MFIYPHIPPGTPPHTSPCQHLRPLYRASYWVGLGWYVCSIEPFKGQRSIVVIPCFHNTCFVMVFWHFFYLYITHNERVYKLMVDDIVENIFNTYLLVSRSTFSRFSSSTPPSKKRRPPPRHTLRYRSKHIELNFECYIYLLYIK